MTFVTRHITRRAFGASLLALTLAGCGLPAVAPAPSAQPANPSAAPALPSAAPAQPSAVPVQPTGAPAQPSAAPVQPTEASLAPISQWTWTEYVDPSGAWRISYPANVLSPLDMGDGLVIFISADRAHFVGVDSRPGAATSAALQNQAAAALTAIYNQRPATIKPLNQIDAPWQTGVEFATARGSAGTAVYQSLAAAAHSYGWLYGYKLDGSMELREALYQTGARLQLSPETSLPAPQDPDPGTTAVVGLLDALMAGDDARPYLIQSLRERVDQGVPLDALLGLRSLAISGYATAGPVRLPGEQGVYVIPVTLTYQDTSERRLFTISQEAGQWKVAYSEIDQPM